MENKLVETDLEISEQAYDSTVEEVNFSFQDLPHYIGHRNRIKERFLNSNPTQFADYELLEILLFLAIPRKDVKPLAKKLLSAFSNLDSLIHADQGRIMEIEGVNRGVLLNLLLVREFINRSLKSKVVNRNVISSWSALLDYLKFTMGNIKVEQFRVLFLNKKNILLADEVMAVGTIDQTPVYPREIIKRALFHEAGAIILVHNHPSGSSKPSPADIDLTVKIAEACNTMNISLHDHVIIAGHEYYSFKTNMLL